MPISGKSKEQLNRPPLRLYNVSTIQNNGKGYRDPLRKVTTARTQVPAYAKHRRPDAPELNGGKE